MNITITPQQAYKCVEELYYRGRFNRSDDIFHNVTFTPDAQQTFMMCIGFIIGIKVSGNIMLAHELAYNLYYQIQMLVPAKLTRPPGKRYGPAYKEIGSDCSGFSFVFAVRREIDKETAEQMRTSEHYVHEVNCFGETQYFFNSLHGGIIFHGSRSMHKLEEMNYNGIHARWWTTHT